MRFVLASKRLFTTGLLTLFSSGLMADFSRTQLVLHPQFPGSNPFILEIRGTWPSDCHPGEQNPVVRSFDGQTLQIEFEIVVEHVTCNTVDTAFRSLVDAREAISATAPTGETLKVNVSFSELEHEQFLNLVCQQPGGCPGTDDPPLLPERGLWVTPNRASEGLLVARQNNTTVIYPLVFDESGRAEWLFSVGQVVEDSLFANLTRFSGGDCFDCESSGAQAEMTRLGQLSVLVDQPGVMQVKVNHRPFLEYRKLVYGFPVLPLGPARDRLLTGLDGRWALTEDHGNIYGTLSDFLPPAFDIKLDFYDPFVDVSTASGLALYLLNTIKGEPFGKLECKGQTIPHKPVEICEYFDLADLTEPLFHFIQDGPSGLTISYARAVLSLGVAPRGKAVRVD